MMFKHLFMAAFAFCFLVLTPIEAEAKRMGGGFSLGKSYSTPAKRETPKQQPAATQQQAAPTPSKPGLGGMMGGLLAGGLIGAMLFGGAFDGIQLMDMLLIGLVLFVLYKLFLAPKMAAAHAGQASNTQANPMNQNYQARTATPEPAPAFVPSQSAPEFTEIKTPDWFDRDAFLEGAVSHFRTLQQAWDARNWDEIARFSSPELLEELKANRAVLEENQRTEVVSVMADVANFTETADEAVLSINFHGWIKERDGGDTEEFSEIWHLTKDMTQENAGWVLVGIQQD